MKKNIGTTDRVVRVIFGLALCISIFFISTSIGFKVVIGVIGIFSIIEALLSRCALYALLGKNTCPIE